MRFGDLNLFHLTAVDSSLTGYFIDAHGAVYSNRGNGLIKRLTGSRTSSNNVYYTLNNRSYRAGDLMKSAKANPMFARETSMDAERAVTTSDRSHAASAEAGVKQRGVVLATIQDGKLHFGSEPKFHLTQKSYESEMERIARASPGVKVVALKVVRSVVAGEVVWE